MNKHNKYLFRTSYFIVQVVCLHCVCKALQQSFEVFSIAASNGETHYIKYTKSCYEEQNIVQAGERRRTNWLSTNKERSGGRSDLCLRKSENETGQQENETDNH
jgi:hypothetical protein